VFGRDEGWDLELLTAKQQTARILRCAGSWWPAAKAPVSSTLLLLGCVQARLRDVFAVGRPDDLECSSGVPQFTLRCSPQRHRSASGPGSFGPWAVPPAPAGRDQNMRFGQGLVTWVWSPFACRHYQVPNQVPLAWVVPLAPGEVTHNTGEQRGCCLRGAEGRMRHPAPTHLGAASCSRGWGGGGAVFICRGTLLNCATAFA
jgi:hypothetical protein